MSNSIKKIKNNEGIIANELYNVVKFKKSTLSRILEKLITGEIKVNYSNRKPYDIEKKIIYNNLVRNKNYVENNSAKLLDCDEVVNSIDNVKPGSKGRIFDHISEIYDEEKHKKMSDVNDLDQLRLVADDIYENVRKRILEEAKVVESLDSFDYEDIYDHVKLLTAYFFAECKILEEPK